MAWVTVQALDEAWLWVSEHGDCGGTPRIVSRIFSEANYDVRREVLGSEDESVIVMRGWFVSQYLRLLYRINGGAYLGLREEEDHGVLLNEEMATPSP